MTVLDQAQRHIESGRTARNRGDLSSALSEYQAAVASLRTLDSPLRLAHTIRHVADIQSLGGDLAAARANYAEALNLYRGNLATGVLDLANALRGHALVMQRLDAPGPAREMWQEARTLYSAVRVQPGVDEADRRIADLDKTQAP